MKKTVRLSREEFAKVHDQFRPAFLSETMGPNFKTVYMVALTPSLTRAYVKKESQK